MGDERSRSLVLRDTNQYQRGNVQIYQWHAIYARHISKYGLVLSKLNQNVFRQTPSIVSIVNFYP